MMMPDNFLRYFLIVALLPAAGIIFEIIQTAVTNPGPGTLDPEALLARADYHQNTIIPLIVRECPRLLYLNAGVAFFILRVPLLGLVSGCSGGVSWTS
jgi:hypothetical protein